jgi:cytochrome c oxidase cbb3-type subunit 3
MRRTLRPAALLSLALITLSSSLHAAHTAGPAPQAGRAAAALYARHCDTCHGKDGRAKTFKAKFNHARDLTDPRWQAEVSDERVFNSISRGRGKMPAWGKKLSQAEIESLVAYVRGLKK